MAVPVHTGPFCLDIHSNVPSIGFRIFLIKSVYLSKCLFHPRPRLSLLPAETHVSEWAAASQRLTHGWLSQQEGFPPSSGGWKPNPTALAGPPLSATEGDPFLAPSRLRVPRRPSVGGSALGGPADPDSPWLATATLESLPPSRVCVPVPLTRSASIVRTYFQITPTYLLGEHDSIRHRGQQM